MLKKLTPILLISASVLFFVSMAYDEESKTQSRNFIFTMFNDLPDLPEEPFAYSDISFPSHFSNDTIETGYDGETDTTILDFVTDDKSTLGRVLFYDKTLSAMENISCASCHKQANSFAENKAFSEGISSLTKRNSMSLNDLGWSNNAGFFWDMSFGDMTEMIGLPLKDENEVGAVIEDVVVKMSMTDYYPDLFIKAYGDYEITEERIVESLVHFISSMVTFDSKFDKAADTNFSTFTQQEFDGLQLFQQSCATCHVEGNFFGINGTEDPFSNHIVMEVPFFFNNGLEVEPIDKGVGDWLEGMDGLYKLPTMRNIALTAPYMHDGRFETLDDVIDFYSEDVVATDWNFLIPADGFNFNSYEKDALKAFLMTLTDESFIVDEKWSDPFESPVNNKNIEIQEISLAVSPNPMSTSAIIDIQNPSNETLQLKVYNELGQLLKSDKIRGESYEMDKNGLIPGVYSIQISGINKMSTIKLIVQ